MRGDEFGNRRLQLSDIAMHASAELFVGELGVAYNARV
jgi:hypothetical protein